MQRLYGLGILLAVLALAGIAVAKDAQESALSWQKQARDTRATVMGVAEQLGKADTSEKPDAAGLITDALGWVEKGDASLADADTKFEKQEFEVASETYNMAWQYYVKAATAGLAAQTMLGN